MNKLLKSTYKKSIFLSPETNGMLQPRLLNCCTEHLTLLTWTYFSPYTAFVQWLCGWKEVFLQSRIQTWCIKPHILKAFHFSHWHWTRVMDSCGFKVTCSGGEILCDWVELVLSIFHYCNMIEEAKLFSPFSYDDTACTIVSYQENMCIEDIYLCVWL
jgi:hypothetical protein